ncbi:hypothetical protein [Roseovarius sp. MMSF_3281]|uniref:hypothetical protein n=1 Tax=Roseovarius sp. MMSF_3281 TaxID=3046694 RepID=UPI00273F94C1|nr:hypothetical protein [Roseovarius sp. MMSF_3281]
MDMSSFDGRKRAEEGVFEPLRHPYTGEPLATGKGAPGFYVRGTAARSVQMRLAEMQKEAKDAAKDDETQEAAMERLHERLIDGAMKYIIRADDKMEYDGQPVGEDPELIRKVLDGTFPEMRIVKDVDGSPITHEIKDDNGELIEVPKFEMANEPFAQQMIKAAEDGSRFFGKTSKG